MYRVSERKAGRNLRRLYCGRRRTQRAYLGKAVGKRQIACFRQGRRRDTVLREAFRGLRQRGADKKRFQKRGSVPRGKRAETGRDFDGLGYFKSSDRRKIKRIFVYEPGFRFGYANGQNPKSDCERNTERIRRKKNIRDCTRLRRRKICVENSQKYRSFSYRTAN